MYRIIRWGILHIREWDRRTPAVHSVYTRYVNRIIRFKLSEWKIMILESGTGEHPEPTLSIRDTWIVLFDGEFFISESGTGEHPEPTLSIRDAWIVLSDWEFAISESGTGEHPEPTLSICHVWIVLFDGKILQTEDTTQGSFMNHDMWDRRIPRDKTGSTLSDFMIEKRKKIEW